MLSDVPILLVLMMKFLSTWTGDSGKGWDKQLMGPICDNMGVEQGDCAIHRIYRIETMSSSRQTHALVLQGLCLGHHQHHALLVLHVKQVDLNNI
jgi:hypothetical protein